MAADDKPVVTGEDLVAGLARLGVGPGMRLMVHSSLSSFGHVPGGAATVIAALQAAVTDEGTLMMPSFNHGLAFSDHGSGCYDPATTATTNGAIPQLFWQQPNVHRSLNPTHAFAAWGRDAKRYTEGHHHTLTMGENSPLGMLWRDGGWCLLIGVGYTSNTFHHVVETVTHAPCLGYRTQGLPIRLADGRVVEGRTWGWRGGSCPINDTGLYGREMAIRGLERQTTVGGATLTLFRLADAFEVIAELLARGYESHPPCSRCPIRPAEARSTARPSDWDWKTGGLTRDSPVWGYDHKG